MASTIRRTARLPGVASTPRPQPKIPRFIASSMVPPRAAMADSDAKRQMADDMREGGQREGGMTRDGLLLLGWLPSQIDRLADAARVRAQSLSVMTA